jgi:hypothetical protein
MPQSISDGALAWQRLVAYTVTAENEMTGTIAADGTISGTNLLGVALMKLVYTGLKYP